MVTIVLLGTGTPNPDPAHAGSAVAVSDGERWVLVDCGRAATHRILEAGLELARLDAVFITHHHSDHVSDLATLAIARWVGGTATPLTVIAPEGPSARYAEACLDAYDDQSFHSQASASAGPRPVIEVRPFDASDTVTTVHSSGTWTVDAALVDHHPVAPAVGYLVRHGELTVAISGDTAPCEGMRRLARGADVLIHEALLGEAVHPRLLEWNASATAVGELARSSGVGRLVLTHTIPPPNSDADRQRYIDDVRAAGYTGPVLVAADLDRLELPDDAVNTRRLRSAGRRRCVGTDHPGGPEPIDAHAEHRRPGRLGDRQCDLAAFGQRGEHALGLGDVACRVVDLHPVHGTAVGRRIVGGHQQLIVDLQGGVHDRVGVRPRHLFLGRHVLRRHQDELTAEDLLVSGERFAAVATEEQIWMKGHGFLLGDRVK